MKTLRLLLAGAALSAPYFPSASLFAQGTAFTYQGVLSQGGAAVNGSNDLTFTLYNAASGGTTVGVSNVVNDLVMSNGLFAVTLDFGAGAFDGSARWLQIAARPGASTGGFTNLAPRTPITATPYAIYAGSAATAGSASSVAASNITGTIEDGRLSANVARVNVGNTFSESQTIRTSAGGLVISSSTGGQFGSGTLRVQGNTGMGADPHPLYRLFVAGNMSASSYVGDGSQLANVVAETYLGPVADSQLSPNIARRANGNAFTGNQVITGGSVGIGTATPNNLLDVEAAGVIGNSTVMGLDIHDTLNRGTKVSFGYNVLGSEFLGMRAVVNPGTAFCGNSGDLLFYTWECNTAPSREVMRINGSGNVGIGTAPVNKLSVAGGADFLNSISLSGNADPGIRLSANGATELASGIATALAHYSSSAAVNDAVIRNSAGKLHLQSGIGAAAITIDTANNVGIGTSTPARKLTVNAGGYGIEHTDGTISMSTYVDGAGGWLGTVSPHALNFFVNDGAWAMSIGTDNNTYFAGEITATAVNITSDRNAKEQFKPVNTRDVLDKVARLPISEWQYKTQGDARHIGPMAQDFRESFALGRDDKHITSVDADGVALAAIQGLNEKLEEQLRDRDQRILELERSMAELKAMLQRAAGGQEGGAK